MGQAEEKHRKYVNSWNLWNKTLGQGFANTLEYNKISTTETEMDNIKKE